jgi:hypothetical protein
MLYINWVFQRRRNQEDESLQSFSHWYLVGFSHVEGETAPRQGEFFDVVLSAHDFGEPHPL